MDQSPHKSDFVNVNGINLHYLDWGGNGAALVFLAGMGCNAHIFDDFAPRFCDKFHVLALTRRGHGESDHPETVYDIDTLTEDIRQFLDALRIERVILAGHSLAGIELCHFNALYPGRVLKLVFLDAIYERHSAAFKDMLENNPWKNIKIPGIDEDHESVEDYNNAMKRAYASFAVIWSEAMQEQSLHEVTQASDEKIVDRMSVSIDKALGETLNGYVPEYSKIKAPSLAFFAFSKGIQNLANDWMTDKQKAALRHHVEMREDPWTRESVEHFRRDVPQAKIVEIPKGHHYCFIHTEDLVYEEMRNFLLG